jgi:hypothetical protein
MSPDLEQRLRRVLAAFNDHDRGCDIWTFDADGKIVRKDSFWKIRER